MRPDSWGVGGPYQAFMGRWSSMVAAQFVPWTGVSPRGLWVDIGCGTGMLSQAILSLADPQAVIAIDPFEGFLRHARTAAQDRRLNCLAGTGGALPIAQGAVDAVVSGLVLNFLERPRLALQRMADACRPGGLVAGYVWDYAGRMEMLRYFWDAAAFLDPEARDLDEGLRFPLCRPEALESVFLESGLKHVAVHSIEIRTQFRNLDDYWEPYLGGVGPAPGYVAGLRPSQREELKDRLRATLPVGSRGQIDLVGRAWAVKGQV